MPMRIKHIDKIAREKGRDVLFVAFSQANLTDDDGHMFIMNHEAYPRNDSYETDENRLAFIKFLEKHDIDWEPVAHYARESGWVSYNGNIYMDVPYDPSLPKYELLRQYLEHDDGTVKNPQVRFFFMSYEFCMKNAHHDEPGFWEKWAETF